MRNYLNLYLDCSSETLLSSHTPTSSCWSFQRFNKYNLAPLRWSPGNLYPIYDYCHLNFSFIGNYIYMYFSTRKTNKIILSSNSDVLLLKSRTFCVLFSTYLRDKIYFISLFSNILLKENNNIFMRIICFV